MRVVLISLIVCSVALPVWAAQAYRAVNWLYVVPITQDSFEVIEGRGAGARDMWCAAADYARRAGLDGVRKRLYILEPRDAARTTADAKGVVFTVSPDEAMKNTPSSYSVTVKRRGENLSISHAYTFCGFRLNDVFGGF